MTSKKQVKVLQGEASESDEEDEIEKTDSNTAVRSALEKSDELAAKNNSSADPGMDDGIICGDGSEAAIEIDSELTTEKPLSPTAAIANYFSASKSPKYSSLLQQKLREKNELLRTHFKKTLTDIYLTAKKDVDEITQLLCKSQTTVQDTSHSMKLVTSDLEPLLEKMDIVVNCNILPEIHFKN